MRPYTSTEDDFSEKLFPRVLTKNLQVNEAEFIFKLLQKDSDIIEMLRRRCLSILN